MWFGVCVFFEMRVVSVLVGGKHGQSVCTAILLLILFVGLEENVAS